MNMMRTLMTLVESASASTIKLSDLPEDMGTIICQFMEEDGNEDVWGNPNLRLPVRTIALSSLPVVPLDDYDRGEEYAREMQPGSTPPIVIANGYFLDGRHRVFIARERGEKTIQAIDLTGFLDNRMKHDKGMGRLTEDVIDNEHGVGQVPDNQNIDYKGLRVRMQPSVFLRLAAPIGDEERGSLGFLIDHLKNGGKIGAPFLDIAIPMPWDDGDLSIPAKVMTHEGRHRMVAVHTVFGDDPVEVHLFFRQGVRARHITPEWLAALRDGLVIEKTGVILSGPLFEHISVSVSQWGN